MIIEDVIRNVEEDIKEIKRRYCIDVSSEIGNVLVVFYTIGKKKDQNKEKLIVIF